MSEKLKKAETKPVSVEEHLRIGVNFRKELRKVLGKIPPEHFIRMALTAMQKQPKLAQCTQESVFQCLLDCASLDLEPDGRRAHLIPFNTKNGMICTLIIDYKGYVDLMTRPGKGNPVAFVDAALVYDKDTFEWNMNRVVRHTFDIMAESRGNPIAAYVAINFKNGQTKYELMTKSEILSIKARSKAKNDGPWANEKSFDFLEMWKKCPLRRAAKWVPINDQMARAMEIDYDRFEELEPGPKSDAPAVPLLAENSEEKKPEKKSEPKPEKKVDKQEPKKNESPATMSEPPADDEDPGPEDPEEQREPGQDDGDDQETLQGDKKEIFKLLHAKYRGNQEVMAKHLKRLSTYKTKKYESKGKENIDALTPNEAKFALIKLREELGLSGNG